MIKLSSKQAYSATSTLHWLIHVPSYIHQTMGIFEYKQNSINSYFPHHIITMPMLQEY
jgi:hypothetical protein